MKKKTFAILNIIFLFCASILYSCSFLSHRNQQDNSFIDSKEKQSENVPREQYEELLKRYKALAMTQSLDMSETNSPEGEVHEIKTPLEEQINLYKKATELVNSNEFTKAMKIFQNLEHSPQLQIKVRAKYQMGLILLTQGDFDLALSVFEEIYARYPQSGIKILSLKKIIHCSQNLNLKEKLEQYTKIYNEHYAQGFGTLTGN